MCIGMPVPVEARGIMSPGAVVMGESRVLGTKSSPERHMLLATKPCFQSVMSDSNMVCSFKSFVSLSAHENFSDLSN